MIAGRASKRGEMHQTHPICQYYCLLPNHLTIRARTFLNGLISRHTRCPAVSYQSSEAGTPETKYLYHNIMAVQYTANAPPTEVSTPHTDAKYLRVRVTTLNVRQKIDPRLRFLISNPGGYGRGVNCIVFCPLSHYFDQRRVRCTNTDITNHNSNENEHQYTARAPSKPNHQTNQQPLISSIELLVIY